MMAAPGSTPTVILIGAGIGGLAAALALPKSWKRWATADREPIGLNWGAAGILPTRLSLREAKIPEVVLASR